MYMRTGGMEGEALPLQETEGPMGNLGQPARVVNKFDLCSVTQKNAIQAAFVNAQADLNNAAAILGTAYGRGSMAPRTRQLLNRHFHTADRSDVGDILRNVFRIGQAFQKGLDFRCLGYCGPLPRVSGAMCGYANATQWFGGFGKIRVCFDNRPTTCSFTKLNPQEQAALIIHEAAHRHVGIDDKAYVWENPTNSSRDYSKLTSKQAMDNADSYAWFCVEL